MFFRWALRHRYIEHSPCDVLMRSRIPARDRVLTANELRIVFSTALEGDDNFSHIVALLVLMGQRRTETASLRWNWIDPRQRTITLPASATKNKRSHTFPYGDLTAQILERIPQQSDYVFPASRDHVRDTPTTVFNGWSKGKEAFDKKVEAVAPWTLHDLRRTFATNLAALGVPPHVVERLLNHVSGTISGVAAIYNRYAYEKECRAAIEVWEKQLRLLLRRPPQRRSLSAAR